MKYAAMIALALIVACGPPERETNSAIFSKLTKVDDSALLFIMNDDLCRWVKIRFFDTTDGDVYPDPPDYLNMGIYLLTTQPGHVVCYGAESPDGTKSFGLGLSGTGTCRNCCITEGYLEVRFYCE